MNLRTPRPAAALVAACALAVTAALTVLGASAAPPALTCGARVNSTSALLQQCVTLAGVREHQQALQEIADENGNTRVGGSPGYDESVDYVADKLAAAGWTVSRQRFEFQTFVSLSPSVLEQISPAPAGPLPHTILSYSGSGDVTGAARTPGGDPLGCYAADFAGFPAGSIALIQRGTPAGFPLPACTFAIKTLNALAAGAIGVVIYNNQAGDIAGTLGSSFTQNIPVVGIQQSLGATLLNTPNLILRVRTDTLRGIAPTENVLAELPGKNRNNVVMAGAHLDSVNAGPGINDNGSGSAALLEVAENLTKVKPQNTIRLAWWAAEESNLVGSTYYINNLAQAERDKIALYLNFDMVGSPNFVYFIYDGDNSDATGAPAGPPGSDLIEKTFEAFYTARGLPFKGTDFTGRSDYGPFIAIGIPSGGLFTGAEGIKTAAEAATWGGTVGTQYDPCYHAACDTFDNNSNTALDTNSDAIAHSVLSYAMSTTLINQTKGKGNFRPPPDPHAPASN